MMSGASFEHRATSSSKLGSILRQLKYMIENLLPEVRELGDKIEIEAEVGQSCHPA